jgi:hypothetical protein
MRQTWMKIDEFGSGQAVQSRGIFCSHEAGLLYNAGDPMGAVTRRVSPWWVSAWQNGGSGRASETLVDGPHLLAAAEVASADWKVIGLFAPAMSARNSGTPSACDGARTNDVVANGELFGMLPKCGC